MIEVLLAGLCTVDVVQRVAELPAPGQKVAAGRVDLAAGGPAANAAVAVAALGARARLVTVLGAHPLAALARADLADCGVDVLDLLPERPDPPPLSAVAVRESDGERAVVSSHVVADPPLAAVRPSLGGVSAVLLDGHLPALALDVATCASDVPVLLDAGSYRPSLEALLPLVDVCACSESFRLPGCDERATEDALHELGVPVVTRTHGAGAVSWSASGERGTVTPVPVRAVDTLGAGDVWHGALAFGIARLAGVPGAPELPALLAEANRVAGLRVSHVGPRAWLS